MKVFKQDSNPHGFVTQSVPMSRHAISPYVGLHGGPIRSENAAVADKLWLDGCESGNGGARFEGWRMMYIRRLLSGRL